MWRPMNRAAPAWKHLFQHPPEGAHLIFWSDGSHDCDAAIETFLRGGIARDDLVMVVLPREELTELEDRMRARGFDLDEMVRGGHLFRAASEDVGPRRPEDVAKIPEDTEAFRLFAKNLGKNGMTVLGRVAPLFFERGEQPMAELIERTAQEHHGDMRILCLYGAQNIRHERLADAVALTRLHTHAITALGGNRFFVEPVQRPLELLEA